MENLETDALHLRLQKAIDEKETIEIKYRKYYGEESERLISDIHWSSEFGDEDQFNDKSYINAFCHLRQERRTFKVERILSINGQSLHIVHEMDSSKGIFQVPQIGLEDHVGGHTISPTSSLTNTSSKEYSKVRMNETISTHSQTSKADVKLHVVQPTSTLNNNESSAPSQAPPKPHREGCYIATMAYGSYEHPQVLKLRRFRDDILLHSVVGTYFVKFYYFTSPKLVTILKGHPDINLFIRKVLDSFVKLITID